MPLWCWKRLIWTIVGKRFESEYDEAERILKMNLSRRLLEEDEELIDFSPDAVPNEVREWLAATFTKQHLQRQKLKFKSVANAIRTGIKFDK